MAYDPNGSVIDPVLTNVSISYVRRAPSVANLLFPRVPSSEQRAAYRIYPPESWGPAFNDDVRGPGGVANETPGEKWSEDTFRAEEHALKHFVPDEEDENNPSGNRGPRIRPLTRGAEIVTNMVLVNRELAARDIATDVNNYNTDHVVTLSGTDQFDDHDNSEPIDVFREANRQFYRSIGVMPNVCIMPFMVFSYLEDHPQIVARYQAQGGVITAEMIASILGVPRIYVPGGYNKTNNPGQPDALAQVWSSDVVLAWVPDSQNARQETPSYGYEFNWTIGGRESVTDRWRDPDRVGTYVRYRRRYDFKMTAVDDSGGQVAGYLIKNAIDPSLAA